jgi:hypothetical protein
MIWNRIGYELHGMFELECRHSLGLWPNAVGIAEVCHANDRPNSQQIACFAVEYFALLD